MNAILLEVGEFVSPRFRRLCSVLKAETPGDCARVAGHLAFWFDAWPGQPEIQSGIFFELSLGDIGAWASMPSPEEAARFGAALREAGYVRTLREVYPDPLGSVRRGWVAMRRDGGAKLDEQVGMLRNRCKGRDMVPFITNKAKRIAAARELGVDTEVLEHTGVVPPGWFTPDPADSRARQADRPAAGEPSAGAHRHDPSCQRKPIQGFAARTAKGTGRPPTDDLLAKVRELRHTDPVGALLAIDDTPRAFACWNRAFAKDASSVREVLCDAVSTNEKWRSLRSPAAYVMGALKRLGLLD